MSKKRKNAVCKKCGAESPAGTRVCAQCGAKIRKPVYKNPALIILFALALILTVARIAVPRNLYHNPTVVQDDTEPSYTYKHVILIGVDGAGAFFRETPTPNIDRIFKNGATSYDVLCSKPTISAQNWGAILTGAEPGRHGLTNIITWVFPRNIFSRYPTIFKDIRKADKDAKLASFSNWKPVNSGIIEFNLGVHKESAGDKELTDRICEYLSANKPAFLFVQLDEVDGSGHCNGWGSEKYLAQITAEDEYIGKIYDALVKNGMIEDSLFMVTADHGGVRGGFTHGETVPPTEDEKYVFLGARGKTVKPGRIGKMKLVDIPAVVLHALNVDRTARWSSRIPENFFNDGETER